MKRFKRVLSLLLCIALLATSIAACSPDTPDEEGNPSESTTTGSGTEGSTDGGSTDTTGSDTVGSDTDGSSTVGTDGSSTGSVTGSTPGNTTGSVTPGTPTNTTGGVTPGSTTGNTPTGNTTGNKSTSSTKGSSTTATTKKTTTGSSKPVELGNIIPSAYGTDAWKPFGTASIYKAKAMNTNFKTHATTSLKTVNGRTRFYVNGKEDAPIMYFGSFAHGPGDRTDEVMSTIGHMMDAGANYVFVDVHINVTNPNLRYASIKTQLEDVLYEYPDAYLIVRYTPWASPDFYNLPQTEGIQFANGTRPGLVSVGSDKWIESAVQQTREMIAYLSKYEEVASRIVGYTPLCYNSGEWFSYDYWNGELDVSEANTRKFREWLKYRYNNDVSALRKAWGQDGVTFATAAIPRVIAGLGRDKMDNGELFQLGTEYRPAVDYVLYYGDVMTDRIQQLARAIKLETNDKSLFIAFYGYYTELFSNACGHFNMNQLLNNEDIDMIAAPVNYEDRNEGGDGISMTYPNSVNIHNKIWMDESDYRSYFTIEGNGTSDIKTKEGMYQIMRREMGRLMVEGSGTWWADISALGWFNDKKFWSEVEDLSDLYVDYNQIAGSNNYDVAFILDEAGCALSGSPWNHLWNLLRNGRHQMATAGLNFSAYTMADLLAGKVDADVLVMTTCYSLTSSQQKKLEAQVHKAGRTVLWNLGFGELTNAQIKSLTGMEFDQVSNFNRRSVTIKSNKSLNFTGNSTILNGVIEPVYKVKSSSGATVLGTFDDGTPALVTKTVGKSRQVFYAGNTWNPDLLQAIATMGGVTVRLDSEDVFYGNDSLAVVYAKTAGKKTITLPKKSDVYCQFTGKWYLGVTQVTVTMDKNATEYFFIGDQAKLKAAGIGR